LIENHDIRDATVKERHGPRFGIFLKLIQPRDARATRQQENRCGGLRSRGL
jgi:hypothetical protein